MFQLRITTPKAPGHKSGNSAVAADPSPGPSPCARVWAAQVESLWDSPSRLRLTSDGKSNYILHRPDLLVPFSLPAGDVKTRGQDPASSHVLKTYSGLVFTILPRDMTRNGRAHRPLEGATLSSPGLSPSTTTALSFGLQFRHSCQGMLLSFRT